MGVCEKQVSWFDLTNFFRGYVSSSYPFSVSHDMYITSSILITFPALFADMAYLEYSAAIYSIPVPIKGDSGLIKGTACLCILEPIKALLASSCSKNGINPAATDVIWFGAISIRSISSFFTTKNSPSFLAET